VSAADRPEPFDPLAVGGWMASLGIEIAQPLSVEPLTGGRSNLTCLATDRVDRRWVLRRRPLGRTAASAHDVTREHTVLSALHRTAAPTPMPLGLCTDPHVSDAPLLLMEFVPGVVADRQGAERLPEQVRAAAETSLVGALAEIHAVDLQATGLDQLASHKPYAARQLRRWLGQWEATKTHDTALVQELHDALASRAPRHEELALVHGDFHLLNALIDPATGLVQAIVDWELCTLGEPLADLGGLLAYWTEPDDPPTAFDSAGRLPGFTGRENLAHQYGLAARRDLSELGFWTSLAYWKQAIIVEGIRRRDLDAGCPAGPFDQSTVDSLLNRAQNSLDAAS
jgi:aminoglycoside phosphotransferase (APT) family kinase protein